MCSDDCVEKENNKNSFLNLLNDSNAIVPAEQIPSMIEFRSAFLYLKTVMDDYDKPFDIDIWHSSRNVSGQYNINCSSLKFNIALKVFNEMKLIDLINSDGDMATLSVLKTEGKVNLEESSFLAGIKKS